jgi:hypothetical protein
MRNINKFSDSEGVYKGEVRMPDGYEGVLVVRNPVKKHIGNSTLCLERKEGDCTLGRRIYEFDDEGNCLGVKHDRDIAINEPRAKHNLLTYRRGVWDLDDDGKIIEVWKGLEVAVE